ncbi:MAG: glycolate oxidase subunit GlcE [Gammaproteobacteria bacterium]|nr:glycolate oxidase subunit GlcE [Gammaproteobacteria bacterium]MCP5299226.1 glycolate oxidase subunit GlcE [Chromatiaceae bacterium]
MTAHDAADAITAQVRDAYEDRRPLRIVGQDSKAFYGRPTTGEPLDLARHSGVIRYEPTELVITARAGTLVTELEQKLAEHGQMLAFEPPSFGGSATIGGAVASGLGGPRRPWGGAPRDLLLGATLLDGRGRRLRFGGEVMKNVAGYDVSRVLAGAMGTLGVLLDVSIKVLPAPAVERSLVLTMGRDRALHKMRELARQPAPLSAACHIEDRLYLRLSGNASSVAAWEKQIGGDGGAGGDFWQSLRNHALPFFAAERPLWRLSLAPALPRLDCEHEVVTDWAGAQRWVYTRCAPAELRNEVAKVGGHAILFRHGDNETPVFHPLDAVSERIHVGLKRRFDPAGILNPGRMYPTL